MSSYSPQVSSKPSLMSRLSKEHYKSDTDKFSITCLNDNSFLEALRYDSNANHLRDALPLVRAREESIKQARQTGKLNATSKDINILLKSGDKSRLVEYLHSMDDNTLKVASKDPIIKEIIDKNPALTQRYFDILALHGEASPVKKTPLRMLSSPAGRGMKPVPFSLASADKIGLDTHTEEYPDIQITGNRQIDMQTLLATPIQQIERVLDENLYVQDEVTDMIRSIITSNEFKRRQASLR